MSDLLYRARWPIREHLRAKPDPKGLRSRVYTAADMDPDLLRMYPNLVEEMNLCHADVWGGEGQPGHGWEGWTDELVPLDEVLSLPVEGEA